MGVKRKRVLTSSDITSAKKSSKFCQGGDEGGPKAVSEAESPGLRGAAASLATSKVNGEEEVNQECPYLDTVNRAMLDFDMEKVCSATLSNTNVYACLVCGKFLHGRGLNTPCYTHSVHQEHFVFINLSTSKIYCLPDNYEVMDRSLDDIKQYLSPSFLETDIEKLDQANTTLVLDDHGGKFFPGFVGMNNLGGTDNINAVVQGLCHVPDFRDFFLREGTYHSSTIPSMQRKVVLALADCVRKIWNSVNFKGVISPQDLVKVIGQASAGNFGPGNSTDTIDFLRFLLSYIHAAFINPELGLSDASQGKSSIVSQCFQGEVEMSEMVTDTETKTVRKGKKCVPFNFLSLEIPPTPLFRESEGGRVVPHLPVHQLLAKFNGRKITEQFLPKAHVKKTFRLTRLPKYLILNCGRKESQNFSKKGRNCTVITFPVRNLEMCSLCGVHEDHFNCPASLDLKSMSTESLQAIIDKYGDLVPACREDSSSPANMAKLVAQACHITTYHLVANICQDSSVASSVDSEVDVFSAGSGKRQQARRAEASKAAQAFKSMVHVQNNACAQWYEIDDLEVEEIEPQAIGLCEADILIYGRAS